MTVVSDNTFTRLAYNGQTVERDISPQQLIHYRDNWYVDAWCHLRKDVRSFAIDAIQSAEILDTPAKELDLAAMRQQLDASYGIFAGTPNKQALYTPTAATPCVCPTLTNANCWATFFALALRCKYWPQPHCAKRSR